MNVISYSRVIKALEIVTLLSIFLLVVHMLTRPYTGLIDLVYSFLIFVAVGIASFFCLSANPEGTGQLSAVLTASVFGLWMFCFFRYSGFVKWPLGYAASLSDYSWLLYYHFILAMTVISPVCLILKITGRKIKLSFGSWKTDNINRFVSTLLFLATCSSFLWAAYQIFHLPLSSTGWIWGFATVCLLKAFITSATEEVCYRGIIQPIAVERYGVAGGIVFQACVYTAFHSHLGAAVNSGSLFLPAVMGLGILFGVVSRLTSGIGWAVLNHMALNAGIEWWNISAVQ